MTPDFLFQGQVWGISNRVEVACPPHLGMIWSWGTDTFQGAGPFVLSPLTVPLELGKHVVCSQWPQVRYWSPSSSGNTYLPLTLAAFMLYWSCGAAWLPNEISFKRDMTADGSLEQVTIAELVRIVRLWVQFEGIGHLIYADWSRVWAKG